MHPQSRAKHRALVTGSITASVTNRGHSSRLRRLQPNCASILILCSCSRRQPVPMMTNVSSATPRECSRHAIRDKLLGFIDRFVWVASILIEWLRSGIACVTLCPRSKRWNSQGNGTIAGLYNYMYTYTILRSLILWLPSQHVEKVRGFGDGFPWILSL